MSKRNFILLIIFLVILLGGVFWYFYSYNKEPGVVEDPGINNFFAQFNPFRDGVIRIPGKEEEPGDEPVDDPGDTYDVGEQFRLRRASSMPIAGFTVFQKERLVEVPVPAVSDATPSVSANPTPPKTEVFPALRYVARSDGNIYQSFADKLEEKKFTTTVIPKVYEALFGNNGNAAVLRYLKPDGITIVTFVGTLPKEILGGDTGSTELKGVFLGDKIQDVSLSSDTNNLFYLAPQGDGITGNTFNFTANKKVQVFDSPFRDWLSLWPNTKIITLTTKPSYAVPGYIYALESGKNILYQLFGGINGLTTLTSPSGKIILYSDNKLDLGIYQTDTKVSTLLGIQTLAEKCAWNKTSTVIYCAAPKEITSTEFPDSWYQGEVSFNDRIWKIDVATGNAEIIKDLDGDGEEKDAIKLALDTTESYLFFVNKKDSFLWELELK